MELGPYLQSILGGSKILLLNMENGANHRLAISLGNYVKLGRIMNPKWIKMKRDGTIV